MNVNILVIFSILLLITTSVKAASKYYDGKIVPYEFGFKIEGNQHRHESKDANGLIAGEFGFWTADDVYHKTVYATDENGNYKIVSMKNTYRITRGTTKTPTTATPVSARTAKSLDVEASTPKSKVLDVVSCSSCKVLEPKPKDNIKVDINTPDTKSNKPVVIGKTNLISNRDKPADSLRKNLAPIIPAIVILNDRIKGSHQSNEKSVPLNPTIIPKSEPVLRPPPKVADDKSDNLFIISTTHTPPVNDLKETIPISISSPEPQITDLITEKNPTVEPLKNIQEIIETNVKTATPAPNLVTRQSVDRISNGKLYRFNYTVGFHGHNEEGDNSGNKEGGYFMIGRDNIRRSVIYVANANGFKPVIRFERVSNPQDAPVEETEKDFGLKGYEFKWFDEKK